MESDSFKGSSSKETGFSASVSAKQPTMTRLNRSASMMALTTGFAILGSDLDKKCDAGVQVDEKDEFGCKINRLHVSLLLLFLQQLWLILLLCCM